MNCKKLLVGCMIIAGIVQCIQTKEEMTVNIGLSETVRAEVAEQLNRLLANEYVLYVKTQKFHWNVVGPHFGPLHKLFNDQYDQLAGIIDSVAERARSIGHAAYGTLHEFAQHATLKEHPGSNPPAAQMITLLLEDHEVIIRQLRAMTSFMAERNAVGIENFCSDLLEKHQKQAWILRSHIIAK